MKNVSQLTSSEVRIFPPDVIPFRLLITPRATSALKAALEFGDAGVNLEAGEVFFQNGTLKLPDSALVVISLLTISDRKIAVQVAGPSEEVELVFSRLTEILVGAGADSVTVDPLLVARETKCVVDLDFSWSDLFSPHIKSFVEELLTASEAPGARPSLKAFTLRLILGYDTPPQLKDYGIGMNDKLFTIEPRTDVPLNQNRFFTHSPTPSEVHLKLIQRLESLMKRKGRK